MTAVPIEMVEMYMRVPSVPMMGYGEEYVNSLSAIAK